MMLAVRFQATSETLAVRSMGLERSERKRTRTTPSKARSSGVLMFQMTSTTLATEAEDGEEGEKQKGREERDGEGE